MNRPLTPKNGIKGVEKRSVQQTLWGSFSGFPLPRVREDRPRFHEDKLRGNDIPHGYGGGSTLVIIQTP